MPLKVGVDVGGTFTDFFVVDEETRRTIRYKRPSTPAQPHEAILDGLGELLALHDLPFSEVGSLFHGTTVGTNALIQRRIGNVALVTSEGFRDLIEIGRQTRPKVYDIHKDFPAPIVPRDCRFEVPARVRADGKVVTALDEDRLRELVPVLLSKKIDCVVVAFLHSFAYPQHERRAVEVLRSALPENVHVIASASVYPEFREYERFTTAVLNGGLLTVMDRYIGNLIMGVKQLGTTARPLISQSSGGLMSADMAKEFPIRASLSGPAAGVSAVVHWAREMGYSDVITLDIGGTSSDVSLIRNYEPNELSLQDIGGFPVRMPAVDVTAVGAGGGTIAWLDKDGLLKVGPQSAGAKPGPACYGLDGTDATTTDANVLLGRLSNEALLGGRMPIKPELADEAIARLATQLGLKTLDTALGILKLAGGTMVKALRKVSIERGYDPSEFVLFAFGGAGPLFAIDVAREIGIYTVVVPINPGLMCAEGLHFCALSNDFVRTYLGELTEVAGLTIDGLRDELSAEAGAWFSSEDVPVEQRDCEWRADLRYHGQNFELSLPLGPEKFNGDAVQRLRLGFHAAHERAYGFSMPDGVVELVSVKLKARQKLEFVGPKELPESQRGVPTRSRSVIFDQIEPVDTPIYDRADLAKGQRIQGPAIIDQQDTTTLVYPGDEAFVDRWGNIVINLRREVA
ncbi:hydantoinase/oxoprolinase family protein [Cupriavidus taiwanensis]|uniref:N-methylhydantoinase (ATP-hydrolyzing) A 1 n=1 Tax=Cupriavidus taiwanensis TaxID=164546 RepID=A0A7Z7JGL0_9BURK|nr:hydantoinase/oxoprolinase family protein [Cupriavidus taiwanensis]SOZ19531.1 N-methylhydantoinase (ATP-hydrolyzing) A 1 [Cupriavidus taiwanensis]SOZ97279.1 N-methylhydantoinase (ATP-hydrolyzing) A 1 [Cupriavidus taiwanensis]SPC26169.1 N-methylhydantoinase (ATP-hydrolyzing) A 1 [Cupriavidus taiwanensis]SPD37697.1 N-methylhydantoinase (ATP-hydrolyzing) A 1 [Cupriavidus taiwanensis]